MIAAGVTEKIFHWFLMTSRELKLNVFPTNRATKKILKKYMDIKNIIDMEKIIKNLIMFSN
jgi:hypothetical protein